MKSIIKYSAMIFISLQLISCASYFKRKECEKTNWYDHGKKVALSGKRLDADAFINECRTVEAEINDMRLDQGFKSGMASYCTTQGAYDTGAKGDKFTYDMCADNKWKKLRAEHKRGVNDFCQPGSGYEAGARGWVYNNICPKDLVKAFMVKYRSGRSVYLQGEIDSKREEISSLNEEIRDLRRRQSMLRRELAELDRTSRTVRLIGRAQNNDKLAQEDQEVAERKSNLRNRIRSLDRKISGGKKRQRSLRTEITQLRREIRALSRG